jgi:hypothetical protein
MDGRGRTERGAEVEGEAGCPSREQRRSSRAVQHLTSDKLLVLPLIVRAALRTEIS